MIEQDSANSPPPLNMAKEFINVCNYISHYMRMNSSYTRYGVLKGFNCTNYINKHILFIYCFSIPNRGGLKNCYLNSIALLTI